MSSSELTGYLFSALLVVIVIRQTKWHALTKRDLIRPLVIVAAVSVTYLNTLPTAGNDLVLEIGGALVGLALGVGCALTTSMRREGNGVVAFRSGAAAVVLWCTGAVARSAFSIYANNGGGKHIASFSAAHSITSSDAWVGGLVLMAIVEVVGRTAVIGYRARRAGWGVKDTAVSQASRTLATV